MIHIISVVMELAYDDDGGEYAVPSTREVENLIDRALYRPTQQMGFEREINIEAAHGTLFDAFGVGYEDDENEIIDVTPKKERRKR